MGLGTADSLESLRTVKMVAAMKNTIETATAKCCMSSPVIPSETKQPQQAGSSHEASTLQTATAEALHWNHSWVQKAVALH